MYDVLIVGAGPAGSAAALDLAASGVRVAVLDYRQRIGDKLCTGIIGSECAALFPPSDDLVYREVNSAVVNSPAGRAYRVVRPRPLALIVDRVAYVRAIAAAAAESGADFALGYRASAVTRTREGVSVSAARNGTAKRFDARLLLIASGFGSPLTKMAGLGDGQEQPYLIGCQMAVEAPGAEEIEVFVGERIGRRSFGWLAPTGGTRALLGIISRSREVAGLERLRDDLTRSGKLNGQATPIKTWGVPIRPMRKTYADRVMALGDAAGMAKPTTGGGIYYGMVSGRAAARTAIEALESGDASAGRLKAYERRWKREFADELRVGYYARILFETMNDSQLEQVMEAFLSESVQSELTRSPDCSFDRHSRIIFETVRDRRIGKLVAGFGPSSARMLARLARETVFG